MAEQSKKSKRIRRKARIRVKVMGSSTRPRLAVFRSHKHFYVQLIDDIHARILAVSSDRTLPAGKSKEEKSVLIQTIAKDIALKAKEQHIEKIVFDRSGYAYHGHVKALAEELRAQGIIV